MIIRECVIYFASFVESFFTLAEKHQFFPTYHVNHSFFITNKSINTRNLQLKPNKIFQFIRIHNYFRDQVFIKYKII